MARKIRLLSLLIVLLVVVLGLYFMLGDVSTTGQVVRGEVFEIGAPLSLTGKTASFGDDVKNGINMAVSEVNQAKDFNLRIIYEDTQSDSTAAVNAVQKLIEFNRVKLIIGPIRSNSVLATAPLAEEKKVIMFVPIASAPDISNAGDYVFRNRETSKNHGKRMAEYLSEKGIDKVAVFSAQATNSLLYKEFFIERLRELGKEIVYSVDYSPDDKDFKTDIMRAKDAEAIYTAPTTGVDAGLLVKQIRELGFDCLIIGNVLFESEEFLNGAGEAAEGTIFSAPAFDLEDQDMQPYRLKYKLLYKKESNSFAANAYDAVKLLADAIDACDGDDTDCVRDYLYGVENYAGVGGLTTFDANGDVVKPVMIKVVRDGKFVKI